MSEHNMRTCPYCNAPLQENATFCLHCMKSLNRKTEIPKKKKTKIIILSTAIPAGVLALAACFFFLIYPRFMGKNTDPSVAAGQYGNSKTEKSTPDQSGGMTDNNGSSNSTDATNPPGWSFAGGLADDGPGPDEYIPYRSGNNGSTYSGGTSGGSTYSGGTSGSTSSGGSTTSGGSTPSGGGSTTSGGSSTTSGGSSTTSGGSHIHNYTASVTKQPTCGDYGTKTYTCSCGASYNQSVSPTNDHDWIPITKSVHHEATGHYDLIKTADAYKYIKCPCCSMTFKSTDPDYINAYKAHLDEVHVPNDSLAAVFRNNYQVKDASAQYDNIWVVDREAYDETVISGYRCNVCGKTK